ncbi:hypothetical protein NDU88_010325 [Pleurodeles waltl]|uniref:Uncharacterized protein n=1 Tax=Pleurodeles waltl TaxID=8319 RepID=A0AAV7QVC6_PLEWA|nr:hypothetical protein NDU88_010325 [Pleurodeles waltl]
MNTDNNEYVRLGLRLGTTAQVQSRKKRMSRASHYREYTGPCSSQHPRLLWKAMDEVDAMERSAERRLSLISVGIFGTGEVTPAEEDRRKIGGGRHKGGEIKRAWGEGSTSFRTDQLS